jgi:hypothetical protein
LNSLAFTAPERVPDLLDRRQKFLSLFPRRDCFIWKTYDQERWQKATRPLLDAQILGLLSDEGRGLFRGCYWSHKTRHAVLDIDAESRYHNVAELQKLQAFLSAVGLYAISYRSSDSGGWHLYLPFSEWVESDEVNQTLKTWLKSLGYEIASGQLEIFPSGNALRLPLQKGFAWLNPDGSIKVRREEIREDEALASFLLDFEKNSRNWQEAKRRIESQIQSAGSRAGAGVQEHEKVISLAGFEDFFQKGKIQETWDKGRDYWLNGLTAKGQRHEAVLAVGHYLWYGDVSGDVPAYPGRRNNETRARLIEAWLEKKHNGFCRHINQEQWKEIQAQIWRAVFWRRSKGYEAYSPYPLSDRLLERLLAVYRETGKLFEIDRMAEANNKREEDARCRIALAVAEIEKDGVVLTKSEVARRAGACWKTVVRHSDLLAFSGGVNNRGVWGGSSSLEGCHEPVAVLTILTPGPGFEKSEKTEHPLCVLGDSGDLKTALPTQGLGIIGAKSGAKVLGNCGLSSNGTETYAKPENTEVAPLTICPANSLRESTQHQDRALRVAAQVLTPGPLDSRIQAEGQMGAGGISFTSATEAGRPSWYTELVTKCGIKEKAGAACIASVHSGFGEKSKFEKRIPDAINYKLLTTSKLGYSSGFVDEFSLISKSKRIITDHVSSSSAELTTRPPTLWLRGPPGQEP